MAHVTSQGMSTRTQLVVRRPVSNDVSDRSCLL
ncbi:hypothetical protein STVIR_7182 [Streptomyces viridochromogenes Tue57]|uniref:Uncharacterized protein n=1 Tax=Streptomyces viridochromogenes Tue57 TaxID=1160705 RepID=L8P6S0_STRVR|nr:hypothetical protein STVIR_7182 [Streptomyces viridochromogenes Tue57]